MSKHVYFLPYTENGCLGSPVVLSSDLTLLYKCFDFSFPFPFPVFPYAPYIVVIPKSYPSL